MAHKKFIQLFFLIPISILTVLFGINWVVDPFNVTNYNILEIKYKIVRDDRIEKILALKTIGRFQNLILGSSRSQRLDPQWMSDFLGGSSYNFGINRGGIEDALGLIIYLEKNNKLPQNILLALDFYSFNEEIPPHPSFYKMKELNFLEYDTYDMDYMGNLLSLDALKASLATLEVYFNHITPDSLFDKHGFRHPTKETSTTLERKEKIEETANHYYNFNYSGGNYHLSQKRFKYLQQFIKLCRDHNINLHIALTPVHAYQLKMILNHPQLSKQLTRFKSQLTQITPFWDGMVQHEKFNSDKYFSDSVHYSNDLGVLILQSIFTGDPL